MNIERMTAILENQASFAALQRSASISDMMLRLNRAGADCSYDECKTILRAWERYADESEPLSFDDMDMVAGGASGADNTVSTDGAGFANYISSLFAIPAPIIK